MSLSCEDFALHPIDKRVILLTGASSGMGRVTALLLAEGAPRLALAARRRERSESLAADMPSRGGEEPLLIVADLREEQACNGAVESCLRRFGRVDVLINNAGVGCPSDLETAPADQYEAMMQTNVDGVFFMTRAVLPIMRRQKRGDIIMTSSPAGITADPVAPLCCASKFALEGFTAGLHLQADPLNEQGIHIRVVNILSGATNSEYWGDRRVPRESFMSSEETASIMLQAVTAKSTVPVKSAQVEQFCFSDWTAAPDSYGMNATTDPSRSPVAGPDVGVPLGGPAQGGELVFCGGG